MNTVKFIKDPLSPEESFTIEGDLLDVLTDQYSEFPRHARIYDKSVSQLTDITPVRKLGEDGDLIVTEEEIDRLKAFKGEAIVVEYPAEPINLILFAVSFLATVLLSPKPPEIQRNTTRLLNADGGSSTNQLSGRANRARPFARIPDIYGRLRVTPDLIGLPLKTFIGGNEEETSIFCIGRGEFDIMDVKEGESPLLNLPDASVSIFKSGQNLHIVPEPQLIIGSRYAPFNIVRQLNVINGQRLQAPNNRNRHYAAVINTFSSGPAGSPVGNVVIGITPSGGGTWSVGDSIYVDIPWSRGPAYGTLVGKFMIIAINSEDRNLVTINTAYGESGFNSGFGTVIISEADTNIDWIGPFDFEASPDGRRQGLSVNVVAPRGLFFDGNRQDTDMSVTVRLEYWLYNEDGTRYVDFLGNTRFSTSAIMTGIGGDTNRVGATLRADPVLPLRGQFRIARTTLAQYSTSFKENAELIVDSAYLLSEYTRNDDFGDVTWGIVTITSNPDSVITRDRKLNMLVTRKVKPVLRGGALGSAIVPSARAIDAIVAMTEDPKIGRRDLSHVNVSNLWDISTEIIEYFGNLKMLEFSAVFDDSNQSYEDMIQIVAQTLLCTPYRRGGVLNLLFQKLNRPARLLFNHRNKEPGSETRTVQWDAAGDRDGVELTYTNPVNDLLATYSVPSTGILNPQRVDGLGIRTVEQARVHAHRIRNRQLYEDTIVEFNATEEASLLIGNDVIICADNTRPETQDGEVLAVDGLTLTTSQNHELGNSGIYSMFLQGVDGTVESIPVISGLNPNQVILSSAPKNPLVTDVDKFARTTYQIVKNDDAKLNRFILTERGSSNNGLYTIQCVNDAPEYYANDQDVRPEP